MRCPQSIEGEPNENPMFIALLVERDSRMVWRAARRVRLYFFCRFGRFRLVKRALFGRNKRVYGRAAKLIDAPSFEVTHDKSYRSLSPCDTDSLPKACA